MTETELCMQIARFQARRVPGYLTDRECRLMVRGWHPKFARIDNDLCERETTIEISSKGFPSVDNVLARAKEAQRERDYANRPPADERPDPLVGRIGTRAAMLVLECGMGYADAKERARVEIEAEMAEGGA